jgi:hypothetical protein
MSRVRLLASIRHLPTNALHWWARDFGPLGRVGFVVAVLGAWLCSPPQPDAAESVIFNEARIRADFVDRLGQQTRSARASAQHWARSNGVPVRFQVKGTQFELMYLDNGMPVYYHTFNNLSAVSTATDIVRDRAPYGLKGEGMTIGLWDSAIPLTSHQEFQNLPNRIVARNEPNLVADCNHATHVAGTLGASGQCPLPPSLGWYGFPPRPPWGVTGMAPLVTIDAYDWDDDLSEMAAGGAAYAGEPNKIYVSNHSYGRGLGWVWDDLSGHAGWYWFGVWKGAESVESGFGRYCSEATKYDEIAYGAPYYLIFVAAGNDRVDDPDVGDEVYYSTDNYVTWQSITYGEDCPPGDGVAKGGYDTIHPGGVAKNVVTVGAITGAINHGAVERGTFWASWRDLTATEMTAFSSWGPSDDGRVKPDVVAKGLWVASAWGPQSDPCSANQNRTYAVKHGTSMACPNVSGSAILLVQYYARLFSGQAMRSSTLKGLILHTADDLGNSGPDYCFGWGLMNTEAAAALLQEHSQQSQGALLTEDHLVGAGDCCTYQVTSDGTRPLRVTLCWTDPNAPEAKSHDDRTPCLVNDLDLRVIGPDGKSVFYPYVLDPLKPADVATTADNKVDNVEQIYIPAPGPGLYIIQVTCKSNIKGGEQWFSLISGCPVVKKRIPSLVWTQRLDEQVPLMVGGISADRLGNVYVAATTNSSDPNRRLDVILLKYDASGNCLWTRQWGNNDGIEDWGDCISTDCLGNVYVAGASYALNSLNRGFLNKWDAAGNLIWTKELSNYDAGGAAVSSMITAYGSLAADGLGNVYLAYTSVDSYDVCVQVRRSWQSSLGQAVWDTGGRWGHGHLCRCFGRCLHHRIYQRSPRRFQQGWGRRIPEQARRDRQHDLDETIWHVRGRLGGRCLFRWSWQNLRHGRHDRLSGRTLRRYRERNWHWLWI